MSSPREAAFGEGPSVAVAVVSWNTRELLSRCLESLRPEAERGVAEVWVVDNASADGSPAMVREQYPWVRLLESTENLGFGAGVNRVADRTATPWIAPANADIELHADCMATLLEVAALHPGAGALAPRLILDDGSIQHSVLPFPTIGFTLAFVLGVNRLSRRLGRRWCLGRGFDSGEERYVPWAVGAFLLVRREAWLDAGGFDEAQWMYAEDLDLGWRLARSGWRTRFVPRAEVRHHESAATTQAWAGSRHARWHASTYAWLARRRGFPYARIVASVNVAGFMLHALVLTPAARFSSRARAARERAIGIARAHSVGLRARDVLARVR